MSTRGRAPPATRGAAAEQLALDFLQQRGLALLARNYRCRLGEIDLILRDGDVTVFVEVRLRSTGTGNAGGAWVDAGASIDARKQKRIVAAARHYLMGKPDLPCRFDCVLLARLDAAAVEWVRDAFSA